MSIIESIILGIVQGLGEFLPISSSGHLVIAADLLNITQNETSLFFNILLHFGTLIAVFIAFRKEIIALIVEFFRWIGDGFKLRNIPERKFILLVIISTIPLVFVYPFKDALETMFSSSLAVGIALIYTSILLFTSDKVIKGTKTIENATKKNAIFVGIMQAIAVIPGVSRAGSTITGGLFCGFSREFAVKYSFIMSIPVILAANVFYAYDAVKTNAIMDINIVVALAGMLAAAVSGILAIKLVRYITKKDKFGYFAAYTLIVGIVVIAINIIR